MKVCPPDLHCFNSKTSRFVSLKNIQTAATQVIGRKNFAISLCGDQIFVTGGMDTGLNLLSEFLIFRPEDGLWQTMRSKKKKTNPLLTARERRSSGGKPSDRKKTVDLGQELHSIAKQAVSSVLRNVQERQLSQATQREPQQPATDAEDPTQQNLLTRRVLKRAHHTICTVKARSEKLRGGYKMDYYTSYIFGGIVQERDGRFRPTNDFIEVESKNVVLDRSQDVETPHKPHVATTGADEVIIKLVQNN